MTLTTNNKVQTQAIERIVDSVDTDNFGVLFHDTKVIEAFQKLSGMGGAYQVEYQHHYINLVGRIDADGQRLDFAIPMAMYNYHQEVSGAAVEFSLAEVSTANDAAMVRAIEKFSEFESTEMYKQLCGYGVTDWQLVGLNSIHAHPSGVNRFSGTDLRADINHPGVNFPLSIGENIPNFASIIQHRALYAEIIHTEYRIFNGIAGGERKYTKGRCLTINKGLPPEPKVERVVRLPGIIDRIFGTTPKQPPEPAPRKDRKDFVLLDQFTDADKEKLEAFSTEMMEMWKDCKFEIDTSHILKTNVLRGRGRLQQTTNTYWNNRHKQVQPGKRARSLEEINEGLFGVNNAETVPETAPSRKTMQNKLIEFDYDPHRVSMMDYYVLKNLYTGIIEDEEEDEIPTTGNDISDQEIPGDPSYMDALEYLSTRGYEKEDLIKDYTYQEMVDAYWVEKLDESEDTDAGILPDVIDEDSIFTHDEMRKMIVADDLMTKEKVDLVSEMNITDVFNEAYQI